LGTGAAVAQLILPKSSIAQKPADEYLVEGDFALLSRRTSWGILQTALFKQSKG
jgi:hypothetical protein